MFYRLEFLFASSSASTHSFLIEGSKAKFKICNYKFEAQNFRIDESKNSTLCNDDSKSYKFQILQFLNLVDYKKNYKN